MRDGNKTRTSRTTRTPARSPLAWSGGCGIGALRNTRQSDRATRVQTGLSSRCGEGEEAGVSFTQLRLVTGNTGRYRGKGHFPPSGSATEQRQRSSSTAEREQRQCGTATRRQTGLSSHFGERAEAGVRNTRIQQVTARNGWYRVVTGKRHPAFSTMPSISSAEESLPLEARGAGCRNFHLRT
jgi:hypothetical protein